MQEKRILVVSDSLGTPIHARGIFNFTYGVVEILRRLGHKTYLLVEPPSIGTFSVTTQRDFEKVESSGLNRTLFSDLIRHFEGDRFRFDWKYSDDSLQWMASQAPGAMNFFLAQEDARATKRQFRFDVVRNEFQEHALSNNSRHLELFDGFLSREGIYSESFRRGGQRLRPVALDVSGFDHVIIDTPHYISVEGIDRKRVHYVIHDFIPFYDGSMSADWRQLFESKVEQTVKIGGSAIFNSETTRRYFYQIFPHNVINRDVTIYPPIREEVSAAALQSDRSMPSRYMRAIQGNKRRERKQWARLVPRARRLARLGAIGRIGVRVPKWQPELPFFCTVLSDEPRKNVAALVKASQAFVGQLNFVVIGQIDGYRHMGGRPDKFPNLHFTGYLSDERKLDLLRSCEGFVFPSLSEGFGIPIVEAATMGAPVICTDIEVFREVTYGKAYYFQPNDPDGLAKAINELRSDPNRRARAAELKVLVDAAFRQDEMADRMKYLLEDM